MQYVPEVIVDLSDGSLAYAPYTNASMPLVSITQVVSNVIDKATSDVKQLDTKYDFAPDASVGMTRTDKPQLLGHTPPRHLDQWPSNSEGARDGVRLPAYTPGDRLLVGRSPPTQRNATPS